MFETSSFAANDPPKGGNRGQGGERGSWLRYRRFEIGKWVDASIEQRDRVDGDDEPRHLSIVCPGCWVSDDIPQMGECSVLLFRWRAYRWIILEHNGGRPLFEFDRYDFILELVEMPALKRDFPFRFCFTVYFTLLFLHCSFISFMFNWI